MILVMMCLSYFILIHQAKCFKKSHHYQPTKTKTERFKPRDLCEIKKQGGGRLVNKRQKNSWRNQKWYSAHYWTNFRLRQSGIGRKFCIFTPQTETQSSVNEAFLRACAICCF